MPLITIVKADGTVPAVSGDGFLLVAGATYYAAGNAGDRASQSFQVIADAAIALTSVAVSDTNTNAALNAATAAWTPKNAAAAVIGTTAAAGFNVTSGVVSKTAGVAGSAMFHLAGYGEARTRLTIVVGGTGGALQIENNGKS